MLLNFIHSLQQYQNRNDGNSNNSTLIDRYSQQCNVVWTTVFRLKFVRKMYNLCLSARKKGFITNTRGFRRHAQIHAWVGTDSILSIFLSFTRDGLCGSAKTQVRGIVLYFLWTQYNLYLASEGGGKGFLEIITLGICSKLLEKSSFQH